MLWLILKWIGIITLVIIIAFIFASCIIAGRSDKK